MINKSWDRITKEDIQRLVDESVPESHTLDYKQELPNESPKSELDFLFDVAAFANASGGDLVFGIAEKREEGRPTAIPEGFLRLKMRGTLDETKRRLENLVRSGISPILSIKINHFDDLPEGPVIVVRVPASWAAPHMVTRYSKEERLSPQFYMRHNGGNHPMDVEEIRAAFIKSGSRVEKIKEFRNQRVQWINRGDDVDSQYPRVASASKVALHLIPVSSFDIVANIDIPRLGKRIWKPSPSFPYAHPRGLQPYFNFDGFLVEQIRMSGETMGYAQIFRNGAIELVRELERENHISNDFEITTIRQVIDLLKLMQEFEIAAPIFIMISLLGVKGFSLIPPPNSNYREIPRKVDRDILLLPECEIDGFDTPVERVLQPAFDTLYQTVGHSHSLSYDENNNWTGENIGFTQIYSAAE
jgi:hypothetical protein